MPFALFFHSTRDIIYVLHFFNAEDGRNYCGSLMSCGLVPEALPGTTSSNICYSRAAAVTSIHLTKICSEAGIPIQVVRSLRAASATLTPDAVVSKEYLQAQVYRCIQIRGIGDEHILATTTSLTMTD